MAYMDETRAARARELGLDDGQIDGLDKLMSDPAGMETPKGFTPETTPNKGRAPDPPKLPGAGQGKGPEDFLPPPGGKPSPLGDTGIPSLTDRTSPSGMPTPTARQDESGQSATPGPTAAPSGTPGPGAGQGGGTAAATRFVQPPQQRSAPTTTAPRASNPMGGVEAAQAVAAPVMGALDNQAQVAQQGTAGMGAAYDAIAERTRQQAVEQRVQRVFMESQERERQQAQEKVMAEYKAAEEERKAFKFKEPWADRSTGAKILAVLAAAIGGYGAGLTGGPNYALQMLQQSMDDDMELQKEKYSQLGDAAQSKLTTLGHMRQRFADDRQAEAATRLAMIEEAQTELQALAVNLQSAQQKKAAADFNAQIEVEKQKIQATLLQPVVEAAARRAATPTPDINNPETLPKDTRERLVQIPGTGEAMLAPTAQEAKEARALTASSKKALGMIDQLIAARKKYGREVANREVVAETEGTAAALQLLQKEIDALGVLSESDKGYLDAQIPSNPLSVWSSDASVIAKLEGARQRIIDGQHAYFEGLGYSPASAYQPTTFQPDEE